MKLAGRLLALFLFAAAAAHAADFAELDRPARQFLRNFAAGRFDAASKDFSEQMRATVTPAVLGDMKQQIEQQLGIFLTIGSVRHEQTAEGLRVVELIARHAKGSASLKVVFDARNRIGSMEISPIAEPKPDPKLETAARELLTDFSEGRFDDVARRFDPALRAQLPPPRLEQLARQVDATYGKFVSVTDVRYGAGNDQTTVELLTVYESAPVSVRVVFDRAGRVAGLKIARSQYVRRH